ncbi:MAG TPA: hypothetical protein VK190_04895 [Pseudoneobacillus sp.]|nr:hypothetical protein [Pseudoneobacillus sp.]
MPKVNVVKGTPAKIEDRINQGDIILIDKEYYFVAQTDFGKLQLIGLSTANRKDDGKYHKDISVTELNSFDQYREWQIIKRGNYTLSLEY